MSRIPPFNRLTTWLLVLSLCFNAGIVLAFAVQNIRNRKGPAGAEEPARVRNLYKKLNLTTEQQEQLDLSKKRLFKELGTLQEDLTVEKEKLAALINAEAPDLEKVFLQLEKIEKIQKSAQRIVVKHIMQERCLMNRKQCEIHSDIIRRYCCPEKCDRSAGPSCVVIDGCP